MTAGLPAMKKPPPLPKGLAGGRGARLWRAVVAVYDLRADERVVLEDACRAVDLGDKLLEELGDAPIMVKGSKGQAREHPLLAELRYQRSLSASLLRQLALPDDPENPRAKQQARSSAGRALARQRWA